MSRFNEIIEEFDLDVETLAEGLFPAHNHPRRAVARLRKGKGELSLSQLQYLTTVTGATLDQLMSPGGWCDEGGACFRRGAYTAQIAHGVTEIRKDGVLISSLTIPNMPVKRYLLTINSIIKAIEY